MAGIYEHFKKEPYQAWILQSAALLHKTSAWHNEQNFGVTQKSLGTEPLGYSDGAY